MYLWKDIGSSYMKIVKNIFHYIKEILEYACIKSNSIHTNKIHWTSTSLYLSKNINMRYRSKLYFYIHTICKYSH